MLRFLNSHINSNGKWPEIDPAKNDSKFHASNAENGSKMRLIVYYRKRKQIGKYIEFWIPNLSEERDSGRDYNYVQIIVDLEEGNIRLFEINLL